MTLPSLKTILLKKKKMILVGVAGLAILGVGGYYALDHFMPSSSNANANAGMNSSSLYKEATVEFGDILVGVTEAGTVVVEVDYVTFDYATTILEVYVSAGEVVSEGDPLVKVDIEDAQELYADALDDLADAERSLENAEILAESQELAALEDYYEAIYTGENAWTIRCNDMDEIEDEYDELCDELDELEDELEALEDAYEVALADYENTYGDTKDLAEALSEAKATLELAEATLEDAQEDFATLTATDDDYDKYKTIRDEAKTEYNTAYAEWSTLDTLNQYETLIAAKEAEITKKETEISSYAATMSTKKLAVSAQYDQNLIDYNNAQATYDNTMETIANTVQAAQDTVDDLEELIADYSEISETGILTATSGGYIMSILEVDDEINSGFTIASIAGSDYVELTVSISQDDIGDVSVGMQTYVLLDAYEEYYISSTVDNIDLTSSSGMSTSVNYTVTIACNVAQYDLTVYDGMTGDVTFIQQQANDVLVLSNTYITNTNGVQTVTKLNEDGSLEVVTITTGFSDGFDTEITSGLEEGDIVILESAVM